MTLGADMAEAYNGQQGDILDPHKDMALALLGALVAVGLQTIAGRRRAAAPVQRWDSGSFLELSTRATRRSRASDS
ncbi:DUF2238 domain-containing protein [Lentzea sp. NBRC 105346]|uniref:DUF2238 domain-containing protein n=1 Tax=Lentzea sp. NBRC 105346 TaxID=3032205 RepID=UPI002552375E|nr:DUF2238 domain-containing protein [Lentzea sp. NBRC 105346]